MAQWIRRLPTEQEIPGSSPGMGFFFVFAHTKVVFDPAFCVDETRVQIKSMEDCAPTFFA